MRKHRLGALLVAGALLLTYAGTTLATDTFTTHWTGGGVENGAIKSVQCDSDNPPGTIYWVLTTGGGNATSGTLTVNGHDYAPGWASGGGWKWQTPLYDVSGLTASASWTGTEGSGKSNLVISHYCPAETTTSTSTTSSSTTSSQTTSSETTSTTSTSSTETTPTTSTTSTSSTRDHSDHVDHIDIVHGDHSDDRDHLERHDVLRDHVDIVHRDDTDDRDHLERHDVLRNDLVRDDIVQPDPSETTSSETTSSETTAGPTPPSTDAMSTGGGSSGGISPLLLIVFAGFLGGALLVLPSRARKRR